jgi:hypothetical protein
LRKLCRVKRGSERKKNIARSRSTVQHRISIGIRLHRKRRSFVSLSHVSCLHYCCTCCVLPPFLFPSACFHWILSRFAAASSAVVCTAASVVYRSIATTTTTTIESTETSPALLLPSQSAAVVSSLPPLLLLLLRAHLILQGYLLGDCYQAPPPHHCSTPPLSRKRAVTGRVLSPLRLAV